MRFSRSGKEFLNSGSLLRRALLAGFFCFAVACGSANAKATRQRKLRSGSRKRTDPSGTTAWAGHSEKEQQCW